MYGDSLATDRARVLIAQLHGTALRYAIPGLTERDRAEALAEIREITAGRDDAPELLAHVAGIITGACRMPELMPQAVAAAGLLVEAGADEFLIDGWASVGAERVAQAEAPPFSRTRR